MNAVGKNLKRLCQREKLTQAPWRNSSDVTRQAVSVLGSGGFTLVKTIPHQNPR